MKEDDKHIYYRIPGPIARYDYTVKHYVPEWSLLSLEMRAWRLRVSDRTHYTYTIAYLMLSTSVLAMSTSLASYCMNS